MNERLKESWRFCLISGMLFNERCRRNGHLRWKSESVENRVRSYFTGTHDGKTLRLVNEIADFEYIVTSSDLEALILEMNLIKNTIRNITSC